MIAALAFAGWLVTGVATRPMPVPAIPSRFIGEWNVDRDHCGTGVSHDRLTIERDRVRYYESGGAVRAVVVDGAGDRELALIASMSGEGMDWLGLLHFMLSPDHQSLWDMGAHGGPVLRHRCPPPAGQAPR